MHRPHMLTLRMIITCCLFMGRLTLQSTRHLRECDSALQHVVLLRADHLVYQAMEQKGRAYYDERTGGAKTSAMMMGSPHLHVWCAM
eukprot:4193088-Heterocapsa_arctica.AAC.1